MFEKGHKINNGRKHARESQVKRLATLKKNDPDGECYKKGWKTRAESGTAPRPGWNKGGKLTSEWAGRIGESNKKRHFTSKAIPEICKMYIVDGMTVQAIADELGAGRHSITMRLKEEGIKIKGIGWFRKGVVVSDETRKKLSESQKRKFKDPEFLNKYYKGMNTTPNKPEKKLFSLLENLYPGQWRYTGDFSFTINGKCPDFVNCNGQKKIIELFGDYWHRGENPQDRINEFKPFGFETLVIWESEMKNIENVKNRIREFHEIK